MVGTVHKTLHFAWCESVCSCVPVPGLGHDCIPTDGLMGPSLQAAAVNFGIYESVQNLSMLSSRAGIPVLIGPQSGHFAKFWSFFALLGDGIEKDLSCPGIQWQHLGASKLEISLEPTPCPFLHMLVNSQPPFPAVQYDFCGIRSMSVL